MVHRRSTVGEGIGLCRRGVVVTSSVITGRGPDCPLTAACLAMQRGGHCCSVLFFTNDLAGSMEIRSRGSESKEREKKEVSVRGGWRDREEGGRLFFRKHSGVRKKAWQEGEEQEEE